MKILYTDKEIVVAVKPYGVLSEDAVYNFIADNQDVLHQMKEFHAKSHIILEENK